MATMPNTITTAMTSATRQNWRKEPSGVADVFTRVEQLARDLDAVAGGTAPPSGVWSPEDSELGPAFVAAASGKYIWTDSDANSDEACQLRRRLAAQRSVAAMLFHPNATHYALLAARPTHRRRSFVIAYRRMIALVHPDTQPVGFRLTRRHASTAPIYFLIREARGIRFPHYCEQTRRRKRSSGESLIQAEWRTSIAGSNLRLVAFGYYAVLRFRASRRSLLWRCGFSRIGSVNCLLKRGDRTRRCAR